jgi:hypothetical protein
LLIILSLQVVLQVVLAALAVAVVVLAVCAAQLPQQAAAVLWNLLYLSRQEFLTQ